MAQHTPKNRRLILIRICTKAGALYIVGAMLLVSIGFHYFSPRIEKVVLEQSVSSNFIAQLLTLQSSPLSLHLHKILGALMIILGALQLTDIVRARYRKLHKVTGYIFLLLSVPVMASALILAMEHAFGGWVERILNSLTTLLFFITLYIGIQAGRTRNFERHRAYMIRNYSILCFAASFRFIAMVGHNLGVSNDVLLFNASWVLALVANLTVAEIYLRSTTPKTSNAQKNPHPDSLQKTITDTE